MTFLQVVWELYLDAMRQAGLGGNEGAYIASGLLTYGAREGDGKLERSPK